WKGSAGEYGYVASVGQAIAEHGDGCPPGRGRWRHTGTGQRDCCYDRPEELIEHVCSPSSSSCAQRTKSHVPYTTRTRLPPQPGLSEFLTNHPPTGDSVRLKQDPYHEAQVIDS